MAWSDFFTTNKAEEAFYFSINRTDVLPHHVNEPLLFFIWCSAYFSGIVINSAALMYSIYIIYESSKRRIKFFAFLLILGISIMISLFYTPEIVNYTTHTLVQTGFSHFENLTCPRKYEEKQIFYVVYAQWCTIKYSYPEGFYRKLFQEFLIYNYVSALNISYFLVAASSTLTPPSKYQVWYTELLACRANRARDLLYIGSLFLTVAIVHEISFDIWLGSLIKKGDILVNYRSHSIGTIIYHGFCYTLTLLSVFIPLDRFFMQNSRELRKIANPCGIPKSWAEWAQEQGFIIFGKGSTYRLLGALSPILISAVSAFVEAIIKSIT